MSFTIASFAAVSASAQTPEICDNGIDDDGDNLIDLNDPDCECSDLEALSLIPNPSFEVMVCCPMTEADLDCAVDWIQASAPTTDYVHECGVLGNPFLMYEAPTPFPDGEGGIGFRDGRSTGQPNYKEYAGACLSQPMETGVMYRLDFFVGFHDEPGSTSFDMAIFASMNCTDLPFGNGDFDFGCPTNGPGWDQLGEMTVAGENEWKNVVFEFEALQDYQTIVLGPACAPNPNIDQDPYFYFDRLAFAKASSFVTPLASIDGNICEGEVILTADGGPNDTYQWYLNGVAINGETSSSITIEPIGTFEGDYEVVVSNAAGCASSAPYSVSLEVTEIFLEEQICEGDSLTVFGSTFTETDLYEINLSSGSGCDSTVFLDLLVNEVLAEDLSASFCAGSSVVINAETFDAAGNFTQTLSSVNGCDSILNISVTELPVTSATEFFEICMGESININGEIYDTTGSYQQNLIGSNGCDSTLNIALSVLPAMEMTEAYEICMGESLTINNETYTSAGTFVQMNTNASGCVTTLNIVVTVLPVSSSTEEYTVCDGESIVVNGVAYDSAGTFVQDVIDADGCVSMLTIIITEEQGESSTETYEICTGETVTVNNETYAFPGTYLQTTTDSNGCESILTVIVNELEAATIEDNFDICLGDTLMVNGIGYASSGIFTQLFTAVNGCDSTLVLNVTVENNCSDCIFDQEMNTGHFTVQRNENGMSIFTLSFDGQEILNQELTAEELASILALVNLENELYFSKGTVPQQSLLHPTKVNQFLVQDEWKNQRSFNSSNVAGLLKGSGVDVPEGTLNYDKLDYSYRRMLDMISDAKVGAKVSYGLR